MRSISWFFFVDILVCCMGEKPCIEYFWGLLRCREMCGVRTYLMWFFRCLFLIQILCCVYQKLELLVPELSFLLMVVSMMSFFVSSLSRSNQRQISSILCLSDYLKVSFGLIPRKNPMLASCWELYFSIFRYARFSRRVSIIPLVELYLEPYFSWEILNSDSRVNEIYIRFVILHSLWSGNSVWCSSSVGNVLLFVIRVLLSAMMAVVSSIFLIASKILWCILGELIASFFYFQGEYQGCTL